MSNKVFKNFQINVGVPFQVKIPLDARYGAAPAGYAEDRNQDSLYDGCPDSLEDGYPDRLEDIGPDRLEDGGFIPPDFGGDAEFDGSGFSGAGMEEKAQAAAESLIRGARAESANIIASAEAEARRIIEASKYEADRQRDKTLEETAAKSVIIRENARGEGENAGREEGRAAYDELIEEAKTIRAEAEFEYKKLIRGAEADALELILEIAEKVIGEEIAYNRNSLMHLIKDAFSNCTNKDEVILKVSSDDYPYILENRDVLLTMAQGIGNLEIKRDLALGQGACNIETPFGNLDAGVLTRISKIKEAFYTILAANQSDFGDLSA